jgi:hypothetical protein
MAAWTEAARSGAESWGQRLTIVLANQALQAMAKKNLLVLKEAWRRCFENFLASINFYHHSALNSSIFSGDFPGSEVDMGRIKTYL